MAGIQKGDVILSLSNETINDASDLRSQVSRTAPGSKVKLRLMRNGEYKEVEVELAELPQKEMTEICTQDSKNPIRAEVSALHGMQFSELTNDIRHVLQLDSEIQGVLIIDINTKSKAYQAGLRRGYVIREINHNPVKNCSDVSQLENTKQNCILLYVWSMGRNNFFVIGS
jgi:S1-C subfamily serine protease